MKKYAFFLITAFLSISFSAIAEPGFQSALNKNETTEQYMVSSVLKLNGSESTIKLVQSLERAKSRPEAIGMAFEKVRAQLPNYSILSTIADVVTPEPKSNCTFI